MLTQRREDAKAMMSVLLCVFAPLRESSFVLARPSYGLLVLTENDYWVMEIGECKMGRSTLRLFIFHFSISNTH